MFRLPLRLARQNRPPPPFFRLEKPLTKKYRTRAPLAFRVLQHGPLRRQHAFNSRPIHYDHRLHKFGYSNWYVNHAKALFKFLQTAYAGR